MRELTCIVCPKGCIITSRQDGKLKGAGCEKGSAYAKQELINPTRMVTSTVILKNGKLPRLPVKTDAPIGKANVIQSVKELDKIVVTPPVKIGDIILENVINTGVNFVATKNA